jgi:hypothetical protein
MNIFYIYCCTPSSVECFIHSFFDAIQKDAGMLRGQQLRGTPSKDQRTTHSQKPKGRPSTRFKNHQQDKNTRQLASLPRSDSPNNTIIRSAAVCVCVWRDEADYGREGKGKRAVLWEKPSVAN